MMFGLQSYGVNFFNVNVVTTVVIVMRKESSAQIIPVVLNRIVKSLILGQSQSLKMLGEKQHIYDTTMLLRYREVENFVICILWVSIMDSLVVKSSVDKKLKIVPPLYGIDDDDDDDDILTMVMDFIMRGRTHDKS